MRNSSKAKIRVFSIVLSLLFMFTSANVYAKEINMMDLLMSVTIISDYLGCSFPPVHPDPGADQLYVKNILITHSNGFTVEKAKIPIRYDYLDADNAFYCAASAFIGLEFDGFISFVNVGDYSTLFYSMIEDLGHAYSSEKDKLTSEPVSVLLDYSFNYSLIREGTTDYLVAERKEK